MSTLPKVVIEAPNKVLFVDDQPERINLLYQAGVLRTGVTYAKDALSAIDFIVDEGPWDVIFLDHDLDTHTQDPYPREVTGRDVARILVDLEWAPKLVVIHSMNPNGADRISMVLQDAGIPWIKLPVASVLD